MNYTALIIDDNPMNLETLALLLKREHVIPIQVQYPREIELVIATLDHIDVIFLDLEFPTHNGFKILDQLRENDRLQNIPVVAYTVHISEQNEARAAGFHSFIGKPLNLERFPDQLQRILSGEHVWEVM